MYKGKLLGFVLWKIMQNLHEINCKKSYCIRSYIMDHYQLTFVTVFS